MGTKWFRRGERVYRFGISMKEEDVGGGRWRFRYLFCEVDKEQCNNGLSKIVIEKTDTPCWKAYSPFWAEKGDLKVVLKKKRDDGDQEDEVPGAIRRMDTKTFVEDLPMTVKEIMAILVPGASKVAGAATRAAPV